MLNVKDVGDDDGDVEAMEKVDGLLLKRSRRKHVKGVKQK
jgi:hypothetical protein